MLFPSKLLKLNLCTFKKASRKRNKVLIRKKVSPLHRVILKKFTTGKKSTQKNTSILKPKLLSIYLVHTARSFAAPFPYDFAFQLFRPMQQLFHNSSLSCSIHILANIFDNVFLTGTPLLMILTFPDQHLCIFVSTFCLSSPKQHEKIKQRT